jgi:hypothetical protein
VGAALLRAGGRTDILTDMTEDALFGTTRLGLKIIHLTCVQFELVDRDSTVGIATCYGLDGSGTESRWGGDFLYPSIPALGPTQPPIQWVPGLCPG